jgi:hypothetical protein
MVATRKADTTCRFRLSRDVVRVEEVVPMRRWLSSAAHAVVGLAMVAMLWPAVPGWLSLAVLAPTAVWFLGLAVTRRRPADVHHAVMAACMVWMAATPAMSPTMALCHGGTGPVTGAAAGYFLVAAAPFLATPLRVGPRGPVLPPLSHGAMSLAMAVILAMHP